MLRQVDRSNSFICNILSIKRYILSIVSPYFLLCWLKNIRVSRTRINSSIYVHLYVENHDLRYIQGWNNTGDSSWEQKKKKGEKCRMKLVQTRTISETNPPIKQLCSTFSSYFSIRKYPCSCMSVLLTLYNNVSISTLTSYICTC